MDRLDAYLEKVCRSIGGPRALRQHVRQELREHLVDAAARHEAAGLAPDAALEQALSEFGSPDEVRSELEATHGHRLLLPVLIDKAVEWKEKTMRAKWLWTTGAFLSLAVVIALEIMFIAFLVMFIVPKFQKLIADGIIDPAILEDQNVNWMATFIFTLQRVAGSYTTEMSLAALALWGLFEWRVKSENKSYMRLFGLGVVAIKLLVVIVVAAGSMVVCFTLAAPAMGRIAHPFAVQEIAATETHLAAVEAASNKADWSAADIAAKAASDCVARLTLGPPLHSLASSKEPPSLEDLRRAGADTQAQLPTLRQSIADKDARLVGVALAKVRISFAPFSAAAKRSPR
ncbi:MAG TPA: permease prefix domain 1-containing protein [Planctomycetia bacterium]|nr:permease prefix domain 1-containing protein [Planctomycetia bacterium]